MLWDVGFALAVISNQGGVARGKYTIEDVERVNARVNELLGGLIDEFRFCPYHPEGSVDEYAREHPWRKPAPGMITTAAAELGIDLSRSWAVGDMTRDVDAGVAAGIANDRCILIGPEGDAPDLAAAVAHIVEESR